MRLPRRGSKARRVRRPTTPVACFLRKHPARGNEVLSTPNPFVLANRHLEAMGEHPVLW